MFKFLWTEKQNFGPPARYGHVIGYDVTRSRVVLFGGRADPVINNKVVPTYFMDTWEWDGLNWTKVSDVGPNPRLRPGFAFDHVRGRLILFGGSDENTKLHRDTWEWNGEDWTQLSDEGPSPAHWLAMTSDSERKQVVLYGGETHNFVKLDETWEWDGEHWTRQEAVGPGKRTKHAMAYDPARRRVVLAGPDDQTWEWDGELWKQVTEIGPGVNESHAMTYDGRAVILFGGDNLQQTGFFKQSGSTWEWDGKHWTQRLQIGPEPRTDCAIAYDSKRDRTVLFGGFHRPSKGPNESFGDTWELAEKLPAIFADTAGGG
jgi:hypothetical protein